MAQPPHKQPTKLRRKQIQPGIGPEKAFGRALREIREGKKISQERLGLEGGFDRTYISLIERGISSPTIRAVVRLAAILNVKPSELVVAMEAQLAKDEKPQKRSTASGPSRKAR